MSKLNVPVCSGTALPSVFKVKHPLIYMRGFRPKDANFNTRPVVPLAGPAVRKPLRSENAELFGRCSITVLDIQDDVAAIGAGSSLPAIPVDDECVILDLNEYVEYSCGRVEASSERCGEVERVDSLLG